MVSLSSKKPKNQSYENEKQEPFVRSRQHNLPYCLEKSIWNAGPDGCLIGSVDGR
jgi:hypothetical protein